MEYTKNYHLPQWAEEDRILMADFNAMCGAIESGITGAQSAAETAQETADAAMELGEAAVQFIEGDGNCRIHSGSYQGTGTFGADNPTALTFPIYPLAVMIQETSNGMYPACVLVRGCGSAMSAGGYSMRVSWSKKGVSWYNTENQYGQNNGIGNTYHYVALGYSAE